jgi:hypothetical protein
MPTSDEDISALLAECLTLQENCEYLSQAHFAAASAGERNARLVLTLPSIIGAIAGALLTASLVPAWVGLLPAIGGVVTAIGGAFGIEKNANSHTQAANLFTQLRHELRALRETFAREMPRGALIAEVRRLADRYNTLAQTSPTTDDKYFKVARKKIKEGVLQADFRSDSGSGGNQLPPANDSKLLK